MVDAETTTRFAWADGVFTLTVPYAGITLRFASVTRKDGLAGTLQVETSHTFVRSVEGIVWRGRVNLLAPQTVTTTVKSLAEAFSVTSDDHAFAWRAWLLELGLRTERALSVGPAPLVADELPVPPTVDHLVLPGGLVVLNKLPMCICGDGEVGKSTLAVWMAGHLVALGHTVLFLDWEENADDFADKRHRLFPGVPLDRLYYHAARRYGPIWDQRDALVTQVRLLGVSYVMVDSVAAAISGSDGGPESAANVSRYFTEIGALGETLGSLHLAHVNKLVAEDDTKRKPANPFGSVFWKNYVRLGYFADTDDEGLSSTRTVALYRNKNNRLSKARVPHLALAFTYDDSVESGRIVVAPTALAEHATLAERLSFSQRIVALLGQGTATTGEIALALYGVDDGEAKQRAGANLRKLERQARVVNLNHGRGAGSEGRWALRARHRDDQLH